LTRTPRTPTVAIQPIVSVLAVSVSLLAGSVVAPRVMALAFVHAAATLGDGSLGQFEPRVRA
jgi:hypothetical protein